MTIDFNLKALMKADFKNGLITDDFKSISKWNFFGRIWNSFHFGKSQVATKINTFIKQNIQLIQNLEENAKKSLEENLTTLQGRFSKKDATFSECMQGSIDIIFPRVVNEAPVSSEKAARAPVAQVAPSGMTLQQLRRAVQTAPVTAWQPASSQVASSSVYQTPPYNSVVASNASALPKGVSLADANRQPARALHGVKRTTEQTPNKAKVALPVVPNEMRESTSSETLFGDVRGVVTTTEGTIKVTESIDFAANLRAQRAAMGLK